MAALTRDIIIEQGATFRLAFTYATEGVDAVTPGPPYDLTGVTARLQIRAKFGDPTVMLEATTDLGDGILLGGVAGTVEIIITDEKSETLGLLAKPVNGVYDFKLAWPSGDETRLLQGAVSISPAVTWDTDVIP